MKGDGRCRWVILQMSTIAVGRLKCVAGHKRKFEGAPRLVLWVGLGQSRAQSADRNHVGGTLVDREGLSCIRLVLTMSIKWSRAFKDINIEVMQCDDNAIDKKQIDLISITMCIKILIHSQLSRVLETSP